MTFLQRKRMEKRMTRRDLAEAANVPIRTIRALENGEVGSPNDETLFPLADALNLDPAVLLESFQPQAPQAA